MINFNPISLNYTRLNYSAQKNKINFEPKFKGRPLSGTPGTTPKPSIEKIEIDVYAEAKKLLKLQKQVQEEEKNKKVKQAEEMVLSILHLRE